MKHLLLSLSILFTLMLPLHAQESEPLVGKIWSVPDKRFVEFNEMLNAIRSKTFVLIGERHGRSAHQDREAFVIGALAETGRYPNIAFEMLADTQDETVRNYRTQNPEYALGLAVPLRWFDSNWPAWSFYQPVFQMAFTTKAKILGADLPDAEQYKMSSTEVSGSDLNSASLGYYEAQMTKAHCGLIEAPRARELARIQIARDTHMAGILKEKKHPTDGVLLIVGSSHIRKEFGIPRHLPPEETAVIALRETSLSISAFEASPEEAISGDQTDFDYIWFTPQIDETSLCDRIGKQ